MVLRFVDRWIWDFWFADDGPDRHVSYLGFVDVVDGMFVGALGDPVPLDVAAIPACDPGLDSAAIGAGRDD